MLSWMGQAWKFVRWLLRNEPEIETLVHEAEPVAREVVDAFTKADGTPLPYSEVAHQQRQIAEATSHKVPSAPSSSPPPTPKPHPTDPER